MIQYFSLFISVVLFMVVIFLLNELKRTSIKNFHTMFSEEVKALEDLKIALNDEAARSAFMYLRCQSDVESLKIRIKETQRINKALVVRLDNLSEALDQTGMHFLNKTWQSYVDHELKQLNESNHSKTESA